MGIFDKAHSKDGHLGKASRMIRRTVRRGWRTEFKLARRANRLAHRMRGESRVDGENIGQVVTFSLLVRIMDDFQSVVVLCREGLTVQAGVVLRSMLEGSVLLRNLHEHEGFLRKYVGSDFLERLKLVKDAQADTTGALDGVKSEALPSIEKELEALIAAEGVKRVTKKQLFEDVGLGPLYQTAYRVLSRDTHVDVRTLVRYVALNDSGDIEATNATPKTEDTEAILVLSVLWLMIALDSTVSPLSLKQFEDEIDSLNQDTIKWSERSEKNGANRANTSGEEDRKLHAD